MFVRSNQSAAIPRCPRAGFTLVELMMVISIIAVLSTFVLVALAGVNQTAKEDRTKAQIKKIHELIMQQWEQYRYRRVPPTEHMVKVRKGLTGGNVNNKRMAIDRLRALRELMRMELPTFITDVTTPANHMRDAIDYRKPYTSSLNRAYQQWAKRAEAETGGWSPTHQQAECLYLIISQIRDADSSALEFFKENEIGDVDGDGMPEILDAWGNPIQWMLWAPGHTSPLQVGMAVNPEQDDMFDPSGLGTAYDAANFTGTYSGDGFAIDFSQLPRTLYPLIYSAGADGKFGIVLSTNQNSSRTIDQNWAVADNDPYNRDTKLKMFLLGAASVQQPDALADDISNHYLTTR